jgi:aspartyl-tRNA(Asn)/glutamyl-tRNA(Gln) amidotransferase subunit C
MPLLREQVEHIARLARLNLTPDEIERYTTELTVILGYIDQLATVETDGVEPRRPHGGTGNNFRDDQVEPSLPREAVLGNVPQHDGEFFLVPRVLGS